ncbi:MAG: hypothetical protein EOO27_07040 [Comamonadaceae bacterium]|nr:MAG: hypothetical protein EOO27_07040 [Comamonadaceae bacterium]
MVKANLNQQAVQLECAIRQYQQVLNTIVVQAIELRDLMTKARHAVENDGGQAQASTHFYLAQNLAAFIGAIADDATGGAFVGGAASWATGDRIDVGDAHHG